MYICTRFLDLFRSTEQRGNKLWLHDWQGKMIAYYDTSTGKTHDWQGKIIGQGNILMMLLK